MSRKTVYNKIVTEDLLNQVNKENIELMDEWVDYLSSVDRSPQTIKQYINNLKIFWVWNLQFNKNKFFVKFTKRDMTKYQNYLLNTLGHSSARVRVLRATLSSLSQYIENILDEEEGFENFKNIINKVESPKGEKVREMDLLEEEDVKNMLDSLIESKEYQKACLIAGLAYSGSRKSEIIQMKTEYFKDEYINNGLYKTPEKIRTKGRGKSGKMLEKYTISAYFKPYFDMWMDKREELGIDSDWLFVRKSKGIWEQIEGTTVDSWFETIKNHTDKEIFVHLFRHFYSTMLSNAGIPHDTIKDIIGWESVTMCDIYVHKDLNNELSNFFNDDGFVEQEESKGLSNL